jgi:hypothetical protein
MSTAYKGMHIFTLILASCFQTGGAIKKSATAVAGEFC